MAPSRPTSRAWRLVLPALLLVAGTALARTALGHASVSPANASWHVALLTPTAPYRALSETPFEVVVSDGLPVTGASVSLALTMPAMDMPPNEVHATAVPARPGHYRGTGVFTMRGAWRITATARKGDRLVREDLNVEVR